MLVGILRTRRCDSASAFRVSLHGRIHYGRYAGGDPSNEEMRLGLGLPRIAARPYPLWSICWWGSFERGDATRPRPSAYRCTAVSIMVDMLVGILRTRRCDSASAFRVSLHI